MIKHIIFASILVFLFVAISIKVADPTITHVDLGSPFLAFLKNCNLELQDFKIEIPSIPKIDSFSELNGFEFIVNAFVTFVNAISGLINFVITILNVVIQLFQFIFIVLKNFITLRDTIIEV